MDSQYVQNLRYKLQKRVRRLNSVDHTIFISSLQQFWRFFDSNPTFVGIAERLLRQFPNNQEIVERVFSNEGQFGESEEEAAAIGYGVLRRLISEAEDNQILHRISRSFRPLNVTRFGLQDALEVVRDVFLEPFYEYVDESLDDQRAMLGLLFRYKHRSEWFYRERLAEVIEKDPQKAEKQLALDLYSYLYDQGLNFHIEPSSISGKIDLIAAQGEEDPLLLDTKVFDADSRSKQYIRKGFNQIYTYTQQYNEPFGYLVIYKITDRDLRFSLKQSSLNLPVVIHNHKTIFIITVDIHVHTKPVSQRSPLNAIEITEDELITTIDDPIIPTEDIA